MFKFFKRQKTTTAKVDKVAVELFRATSEASDDMLTAMSKHGLRSKEHNEAYQKFHTLYQMILRAKIKDEYDDFCERKHFAERSAIIVEVV